MVNVIGTEKSDMIQILEKIILDILNKQSFSKINYKLTSKISDDDKWIADQLQSSSMSVLLQKLKKIDSDLMYDIDKKGKRSRKRNTKLMRLIQRQRLDERIVMNKKRVNYLVDQCDICEKKFGEGEPQCHHMIPFERQGPDDSLNYAFLCGECHKIFTHEEFSKRQKDATDQLKLRNLVSQENYKEMIKNNLLTPDLIDYLMYAGYIHAVQRLELHKIWTLHENLIDKPIPPKTMPSGKRWERGMISVYNLRIRHNLIMEQVKDNYKTRSCDGCDAQFKKSEPECHHIIPKKQKHRGQAPNGPESPYNYAFLCIQCHQKFTSQIQERKVIVKILKNKGLVTKETVKKMILHDGLNELQLDYLLTEKYIDKTEHKELLDLMNQKKNYLN